MPLPNEVIIAAAGSGKTSLLIEKALADRSKRVLITTYTRENLREIDRRLWDASRRESYRVTAMSWFEFLLRECVKPYQAYKTEMLSIRSINFVTRKSSIPALKYARKADFDKYYVDSSRNLYREVVSDLACAIDEASGGKVIARLEGCYDLILVDEVQDLAGPDLDLLERIFDSDIGVIAVGDPRQGVYATNSANRNRQHRRAAIVNWIDEQLKRGRITRDSLSHNHRCNQAICDYADALYPDLPPSVSTNDEVVKDAGVHLVHEDDLDSYRETYGPQELRWDKREARARAGALNMGEVKGMAFDRVLIYPPKTITSYIESGANLAPGTRAKFYVAITRARHSVAVVTNSPSLRSGLPMWSPTASHRT